jgi:hypothetical protein
MSNISMRHGVFVAPLHPVDEDPHALIHRDLELMEWLDHCITGAVYCRCR